MTADCANEPVKWHIWLYRLLQVGELFNCALHSTLQQLNINNISKVSPGHRAADISSLLSLLQTQKKRLRMYLSVEMHSKARFCFCNTQKTQIIPVLKLFIYFLGLSLFWIAYLLNFFDFFVDDSMKQNQNVQHIKYES